MLAHVNPEEAALLKARGGSGTINPQTGLLEFFESGVGRSVYGVTPDSSAKATNILGQAFGPELLQDVPDKLPTTTMPPEFGGMGTSRPAYDKVNPEYAQYATRDPYGGMGTGGQVNGYEIPTGKFFQGEPLVAKYDAKGNFQFATLTGASVLRPDPSRPNIIAQPKITKDGGIIDYGIGDTNANKGGFLSDLGGMVSDLSPIILAALGANFLPGLLGGGAAGTAGATGGAAAGGAAGAAGALSPYAAQAAGAYGGSAAAAQAAAAGSLAGIETASAAQNALNLGVPTGGGVTTGGQDITQLRDQLANTPMPTVTSGPPIAGEVVEGALPEIAAETTASASDIAANDALAKANQVAQAAGGFTPAAATGLLSSLGDVGTAIMDFATKNPSIAGSLLGAVTGAIGAANAPKEATTQSNIDPQLRTEYLANIERAKTAAAGLGVRQFAEPGAMYTDAEKKLYNLGMTPFGAEDIARFYNPYQEQVVQGALGDIERTRQMQEQANMEQATRARAFGGSRQGVVSGMTNEAALRQAATTGAQLRSAGFNTAANLGLAARPMDIAGLQTSLGLGTARTALEQARLDALRNLGQERLAITSGSLGIGIPNIGGSTSQPLYSNVAGSALSGGLTGSYIGSLLQPRPT